MRSLLPQSAPDVDIESVSLREPIGKIWSAVPILAGSAFPVLACSGDWSVAVFGGHYAAAVPLRCLVALVGFLLMSSALPTYYISVITESPAVGAMLQVVCSFDPAFKTSFSDSLGSIKKASMIHAVLLTAVYGLVGWIACRTELGAVFLGVGGGAISLTTKAQKMFLDLLIQLCDKDIDTFIDKYLPEDDQERGVNWKDAAAAHYELDLRLEGLWAPTMGSMLVCPLVARNCALGGILLVFGVVRDETLLKVAVWVVGAALMLSGIQTLQGPANITTRCISTSPRLGRRAIKAVVNSMTCRSWTSEQEEVFHVKFMHYLGSTTVGVELFGVLVTPSLVVHVLVAMGTNLPIAVGILEGLLKQR